MGELKTLTKKSEACRICNFDEINEFKYGPLFQREGFVAHYYCVLFSYQMQQKGKDDEGILGFLIKDIKEEIKRVKNILCVYCKKPNASIACANKKCGKTFHYPCGVAKGSLHQFKDSFKSYCFNHRPIQDIPEKALRDAENNQVPCAICYDSVDYRSITDTIWANCCCTTWYHRDCLQMHALSSGYFFKCAICNNNKKFKNWVEKYGIFVPKKDASWELEPNAFDELSRQYGHCDAVECKCPNGRECDVIDTMWEIILCRSCGSQGMHIMCGPLKFHKPVWQCELCKTVSAKVCSERLKQVAKSMRARERKNNKKSLLEGFSNGECSGSDGLLVGKNSKSRSGKAFGKKRKREEAEDGENALKRNNKQMKTCVVKKRRKAHSRKEKDTKLSKDPLLRENLDLKGNNNEVGKIEENPTTRDRNSLEPEDSDDPDDSFSLEEIKRRKKIEEDGLEIIDLTTAPPISEEEVMEIMEVYRNYQMTDLKYRVKKEFLTVSDDETDEPEVEVLDKIESPVIARELQKINLNQINDSNNRSKRRKRSTVNISLSMELQIKSKDGTSEEIVVQENNVSKNTISADIAEIKRRDETEVTVTSLSVSSQEELSSPRKTIGGKLKAISPTTIDLKQTEVLNRFENEIEKLLNICLTPKKSKSKYIRRRSMIGMNQLGSSGEENTDKENVDVESDVEVIDVVKFGSSDAGSQSSAGFSGSEEEVIEID